MFVKKIFAGQFLQERDDFKCYCQHKNGRGERSGIMCGLVEIINGTLFGDFTDISQCNGNEWCTGPSSKDESIQGLNYGTDVLCTKGRQCIFWLDVLF